MRGAELFITIQPKGTISMPTTDSSIPSSQEVFDTVVNHLRAQGKQALNAKGVCAYRTPDGLVCVRCSDH
jgi:hypothetical protein